MTLFRKRYLFVQLWPMRVRNNEMTQGTMEDHEYSVIWYHVPEWYSK
jgi:hypothetical protein